jgi:hypothetical protein
MSRCIIEMVDYTRNVNNDIVMVDVVDHQEDTFPYICTGARVDHFPGGN